MKVAVAISGGADSYITALILRREGYRVFGIHMRIFEGQEELPAIYDFPVYEVDLKDIFFEKVIKYFCLEYIRGRTPNPCVICNEIIKFGFLFDKAMEMGAELFATGHYARVDKGCLLKGLDENKDQSYMLYRIKRERLRKLLMPLGWKRKKELEDMKGLGFRESQEICFVRGRRYTELIKSLFPEKIKPGPILKDGKEIGEHKGIIHYTIGQRRGIGAHKKPLFVIRIDAENNAIHVGEEEELYRDRFTVSDIRLIRDVKEPFLAKVKVRYRAPEVPAEIVPLGDRFEVRLKEPLRAITPGQSAVFYEGDAVIGGGIID